MTALELAEIVAGEAECGCGNPACTPLTLDDLWNDETLADEQKAEIYDGLFEYHGDEGDDDDRNDFELYDHA